VLVRLCFFMVASHRLQLNNLKCTERLWWNSFRIRLLRYNDKFSLFVAKNWHRILAAGVYF